jgi:hypothetical protein
VAEIRNPKQTRIAKIRKTGNQIYFGFQIPISPRVGFSAALIPSFPLFSAFRICFEFRYSDFGFSRDVAGTRSNLQGAIAKRREPGALHGRVYLLIPRFVLIRICFEFRYSDFGFPGVYERIHAELAQQSAVRRRWKLQA